MTASINRNGSFNVISAAKDAGVKRFILASSSSVYGVSDAPNVTEDIPTNPLTEYSKSKVFCEAMLNCMNDGWTVTTVRPATVCGYSPRMRFDVVVNALTRDAIGKGAITIYGDQQYRPNIHIEDMCDFYLLLLQVDHEKIHNKIFNVGGPNYSLRSISELVDSNFSEALKINFEENKDPRSYRISSMLAEIELGWKPKRSLSFAISNIKEAVNRGFLKDLYSDKYSNIATMKKLQLK